MSSPEARSQVQTWLSDEAAEAWQRSQATRAQATAEATQLMLELAGVRPGARVLDVAAGTGDQSLAAARIVGPNGYVLATDLSPAMLAQAVRVAEQAGLTQIHTQIADAQELDLQADSFDAAICRFGVMFFPDRRKALAAIRRVLKSGCKLAAAVWAAREKNPYMALPLTVVERRTGDAAAQSAIAIALSMGEPKMVEQELAGAGFVDVAVHSAPVNRRFDSAAEVLKALREAPPGEVVQQLPEGEREDAWREVEAELRKFETPEGCEFSGEVLIGVGTK